ncbi:MAG: hypothetical protein FWH55_10220, partial [Oscillospiraceae bacterium]|nr:hypothetical protein [Oscillospiraceae bacterium]
MKRIVSIILILSMLLALAPMSNIAFGAPETVSNETALTPFQAELESKYIDPDRVYSTEVRWWLGSASHTAETLLEEIQALYDGGFRGVELCMQSDGDTANNAIYAYGSAEWAYKWKLMINKLLDLGMTVSLTSGTNWSTSNVPWNAAAQEGLDPDSQAALQSFMLGSATVAPGASLAKLPAPTRDGENSTVASNRLRSAATFLGAYLYEQTGTETIRVTAPGSSATNYTFDNLDYNSGVDLAKYIEEGATVWDYDLDWAKAISAEGLDPAKTYRGFAYWFQ